MTSPLLPAYQHSLPEANKRRYRALEIEMTTDVINQKERDFWGAYFGSHVNFLLADLGDKDEARLDAARNVICCNAGDYELVGTLDDKASKQGLNSQIYEIWAYEYAQQIKQLVRGISNPVASRALMVCAERNISFDVSYSDMSEAKSEAREALYGDGEDAPD